MNLNEYQAKNILRENHIAVPAGVVCESAEMAQVLCTGLGASPWVIKAQIPAGGRARGHFKDDPQSRGGIRFADTPEQLHSHAKQMLGSILVTAQTGRSGATVHSVYIEEQCQVAHEYYLALTIDTASGQVMFVASRHGGTNIETMAEQAPDELLRYPLLLDQPFEQAGVMADALGIDSGVREEFIRTVQSMYAVFVEKDMLLLEINPLAQTTDTKLIALDATIVFDDNALFRQGHQEQMNAYEDLHDQEYAAAVHGLNYVKLTGNIATLSAGAGLAMATVDAIKECGGEPANFLDVPPSTTVATLKNAVNLLTSDPDTRCVLLNVFGGGIMRCDAVADALLLANRERPFDVPVVVRVAGTNADLATTRLTASLPSVIMAADLADAAMKSATCAAKAGGASETIDDRSTWWKKIRRLIPDAIEDRS